MESPGDRDDYGWFEDVEYPGQRPHSLEYSTHRLLYKALTLPPAVAEPPAYILESNLETQQLWYGTAGQRAKQPTREREYFEKEWSKNFERSSVEGLDQLPSNSSDKIPRSEFNAEIVARGKSPFSNSVSKSFFNDQITSITVQVPQFRIMRTEDGVRYAEFLVLVSVGAQSSVTLGIWKRHSEFSRLAKLICDGEISAAVAVSGGDGTATPPNSPVAAGATSSSHDLQQFKNTALSWQCVLQRKKWFKCLDKDYLSLKCFLLERFMHDLLFESPSPAIVSSFLGLMTPGDDPRGLGSDDAQHQQQQHK